jgi:SAM-dependent methyltransferase
MPDNQSSHSGERPAGALNTFAAPSRHPLLAWASTRDLCVELLARLASGEKIASDRDLVVAGQLQDRLDVMLDVHLNRFSRRRLIDTTHQFFRQYPPESFRGLTVVDLGCGSLNPFTLSFLFVLLGASRAYAIDLEPIQDEPRAVRALADVAAWLLVDSARLIGSRVELVDVVQRLQAFDLPAIERGERAGVPPDRLQYLQESITELSLADGEVDLITSVSVLEHVDDIDATLASLQRVTAVGGRGHHVVDFVDHRLYGGDVTDPLAFLRIDTKDALVHGSNRLRIGQLRAAFERHGFEVERVVPCRTDTVTDADRATFVEPFRSMPLDELSMTCARVFVRRQ